MKISAKEYWTEIFPQCMKELGEIPKKYYNMITPYKSLQEKIDKTVIKEFLDESATDLVQEFVYDCDLKYLGCYYITSSYDTNEAEDIIKKIYKVTYIDDETVDILTKEK